MITRNRCPRSREIGARVNAKYAAIRDLKMPDRGGGWIANSLVYKDR